MVVGILASIEFDEFEPWAKGWFPTGLNNIIGVVYNTQSFLTNTQIIPYASDLSPMILPVATDCSWSYLSQ